jgi:hypothetical protein
MHFHALKSTLSSLNMIRSESELGQGGGTSPAEAVILSQL